jgi:glutamyl-tRNA synthetase
VKVDRDLLAKAVPLVQTRMARLTEAPGLLRFLFEPEDEFAVEEAAATKALGEGSGAVLRAVLEALEPVEEWTAARIEPEVWGVGERLGLNKRKTAAPVRVAITGRLVSPPLFESMELLGRERSLRRLRRAAETAG